MSSLISQRGFQSVIASSRQAKRAKVDSSGSRNIPVKLLYADHEPTSPPKRKKAAKVKLGTGFDFKTDILDNMLGELDDLDRTTHLGALETHIQTLEAQLEEIEAMIISDQEQQVSVLVRLEETKSFSSQVFSGEIQFDARTEEEHSKGAQFLETGKYHRCYTGRISRGQANLAAASELLEKVGSFGSRSETMHKALSRWLQSLRNIKGLWTRIWNVWEDWNKPGPSHASAGLRQQWDEDEVSIVQELARLEEGNKIAMQEYHEAQEAAVSGEIPTDAEMAALQWAADNLPESAESAYALLCHTKDVF